MGIPMHHITFFNEITMFSNWRIKMLVGVGINKGKILDNQVELEVSNLRGPSSIVNRNRTLSEVEGYRA